MAQGIAIVRNTLPVTVGGTSDFTSTGFGTAAAAIIIANNANTTNNPQVSSCLSIGFWDGTNQRSISAQDISGLTTTDVRRRSSASHGVSGNLASGGTYSDWSVSAITDGIRLTMDNDNTGAQRYCTVILLKGVSANVHSIVPNATQNSTQASASLGFAPKLVFFATIGHSVESTGDDNAILTFGFAEIGGTHRMIGFSHVDAVTTTRETIQYSETRCVGQAFDGTLNWSAEVTTWGADTYTLTTRDGGSGSDYVFALALGGADLSYDCGTLTTPAATGNDAIATDVDADALLLMLSTASSTTIKTDSEAEGVCIGVADGTNQYLHAETFEDNVGTTFSRSIASAAAIVDLDDASGGAANAVADATVSSFNPTNVTLNWSAVPVTARKGWWVAFGAVPAGSSSPSTSPSTSASSTPSASVSSSPSASPSASASASPSASASASPSATPSASASSSPSSSPSASSSPSSSLSASPSSTPSASASSSPSASASSTPSASVSASPSSSPSASVSSTPSSSVSASPSTSPSGDEVTITIEGNVFTRETGGVNVDSNRLLKFQMANSNNLTFTFEETSVT